MSSKLILASGFAGSGYITNKIFDQKTANTGKIEPAKTDRINPKGINTTGWFNGIN